MLKYCLFAVLLFSLVGCGGPNPEVGGKITIGLTGNVKENQLIYHNKHWWRVKRISDNHGTILISYQSYKFVELELED